MPLRCATATGTPRRRCWTVCEARDKTAFAAATSDATAALPPRPSSSCPRRRTSSLRLSLDNTDAFTNFDARESSHCEQPSPRTSPSFSFHTLDDMFAAMNSPVLRTPLPISEPASVAKLQVLSPTIKRQRKSTGGSSICTRTDTSTSCSRAAVTLEPPQSRASRRYTSILSRCLPRQLKRDHAPQSCLSGTSESPRGNHVRRATETPAAPSSITYPTSCAQLQLLLASSPSPTRKRLNTILLTDDNHDLHLFRDEAEYSDYLSVRVTGAHTEIDRVVFYELEVHLSQMHWTLYRRFSEFRALRQDLIKHFTKRLRLQRAAGGVSTCEICAHMLEAIETTAFPSRQQTHRHWHKLFASAPEASSASGNSSRAPDSAAAAAAAVIADRKAKFSEFVGLCMRTVRGLRQHGKVMEDSSACEIGTALRLIEEFFGLSFTRYLRFLSERGVVDDRATTAALSPCVNESSRVRDAVQTWRRLTSAV